MKNRLSDLNNHLFATLERLADEDLAPEKIEQEVKRANAIVGVSDQIVKAADLTLKAAKFADEIGARFRADLPMIGFGGVAPVTAPKTTGAE